MAKKSAKADGKSLVIVESPAKARTISKFLGRDYIVEASIGHIRDLPSNAEEVPAEIKGEPWARLGVNVEKQFEPVYIVPPEKRSQVSKLKTLLKESKDLYLATDEDREGEAISWHLHEVLKPKVPVHRLVFHEITEEAIKDALDHTRPIDDGLVRAQETRRILDRLYGYEVSPLLWRKIGPKLSAGRVQSVAVRLIVSRERERMAFVSATYWDLLARLATKGGSQFEAGLVSVDGKKVPSGRDFDAATGKIKDPNLALMSEADAQRLIENIRRGPFKVINVEERPFTSKPSAPFTTSTLQQEANRKLGFTARRTMDVAQSLYENGYITYMRTDSTNLAQVAIDAARDLVRTEYGAEFLYDQPRVYKSKVKNAQEAHEAIRPAGHPFKLPDALKSELNPDQFRLFDMIWKRTIASQMADARGRNTTVQIESHGSVFQVTGKTIDFAGFLRAYVEGSDDPDAAMAEKEVILPSLAKGDEVDLRNLEGKSHTTQPPARFSEASLTKTLEEMGIGRPSTYASIIDTILNRKYVFKKSNALVPTWIAFSVSKLMEQHLPALVDYQFTAQMEDLLDSISRGESEAVGYLNEFYYGDEKRLADQSSGLKARLARKIEEVDPRDISRFPVGRPETGPYTEEIVLRVGKYGPFLEQGTRKASLPEEMCPDELTLEKSLELLEKSAVGDEPLGHDPESGRPIFVKQGRFGPYIQLGTTDDEEKPKNASLLKGMEPTDVTLEVALKLLSLPRTLGKKPDSGDEIIATNGRFGPYIKCGADTRSLPKEVSPIDVTLEQALELLAQPKQLGRGRGAAAPPLKVLGDSPVTSQPVRVMNGRYGAYVADGESNASLPKGVTVEDITLEAALALLAERAGKSSKKKKRPAKKAATKKAAKKAPAATEDNGATPKKAAKKATKKAAKKAAPKKKAGGTTATNVDDEDLAPF